MKKTNFDFMGGRLIAAAVSGTLLVVSIVALAVLGLNRGLDFTGGALVEVGFDAPVAPQDVRQQLESSGFARAVVQNFGSETEVLIRVPPQSGLDQSTVGDDILALLRNAYGGVTLRRSEVVGPAVGEELTEKGGIAMLVALAVVMLYIMFRFTGKFAVGAVTALAHDVIVALGAFARLSLDLQPGGTRGDSRRHRLFAERHHRRLGPDPGELPYRAPGQAHRNHQPVPERNARSDVGDIVDDPACPARAAGGRR